MYPIGRDKALFSLSFGFSRERWEELANAFTAHAASNEIAFEEGSEWGKNYSIIGTRECPDGRHPVVTSVWFAGHGGTVPRLITANPE
jgi:hypothetical protein